MIEANRYSSGEQIVTEADMLNRYGQEIVMQLGGRPVTLVALMEKLDDVCPADDEALQDEDARVVRIASVIGDRRLISQHHFLLELLPKET